MQSETRFMVFKVGLKYKKMWSENAIKCDYY